jgi:hypothetical protein
MTGRLNLILASHENENVARRTGNVDSHGLLHCTFNIIFTRTFTVQDIYWKCSPRDVENRYTATDSEITYVGQMNARHGDYFFCN